MNESLKKFGSISCFVAGALYIVYGILFALDPIPKGDYSGPVGMFETFMAGESVHLGFHLSYALLGLALLLVVGIYAVLPRPKESQSWVVVATILGALGAMMITIIQARFYHFEPAWARAFLSGDAATRQLIMEIMPLLNPDPLWLFQSVALGAWMVIVSYVALKDNTFENAIISYAGIASGVATWLMALGHNTGIAILIIVGGVIVCLIAGPIWLFGTGAMLWRNNQTATVSSMEPTVAS